MAKLPAVVIFVLMLGLFGQTATAACDSWFRYSPHQVGFERSYFSQGPMQVLIQTTKHPRPPKKLTLFTLNTYGLTTAQLSTHLNGHYNFWQTTLAESKSPKDLQRIALSILETKSDIVFLQEVKSVNVLKNFNQHYLQGRYRVMMFEQNGNPNLRTDLHVHTGVLIKKSLSLDFELHSYRELSGTYQGKQIPVFTHDFLVLVVRTPGLVLTRPPLMVLGLVHLKARKSLVNDPQGLIMRQLQVHALQKAMHQIQRTFTAEVPFFLMGDFNGDLRTATELGPIFQEGLYDVLDDVENDDYTRVTHTFHGVKNGPVELVKGQLDAILGNQTAQRKQMVRDAGIYRWKDTAGNIRPLPSTLEERTQNPSDHFPVWAVIENLR